MMANSLAYWRHRFTQTNEHIGQLMSKEERQAILRQARARAGGEAKAAKMKQKKLEELEKHDGLVSKDAVFYRVGDEYDLCANCCHFNEELSTCAIVEGYIDPRATCDMFMMKEVEKSDLTPGDVHVEGIAAERKKKKKMSYVNKSNVVKFDDDKRIVYGVALEPYTFDKQGDWETPEDIEWTAHQFLSLYRMQGVEHVKKNDKIVPIESYLAPFHFEWTKPDGEVEFVKKGSWIIGSKINDEEVWGDVKKGELNGFSIQGEGQRDEDDQEWPSMWYFDGFVPVEKAEASKNELDNAMEDDFAGRNRSFPIMKSADVDAALYYADLASDDNYETEELKKNIIEIAKRKKLSSSYGKW